MSDAPPVRQPLRIDDTFAWAITAGPVVTLLLAVVLASVYPDMNPGVVTVVMVILNTWLAVNDRKRVMAAGYAGTSAFWGFLFMPAYLVMRGRQVGNWAIPLTYAFTFLVYLAVVATVS